MSADDATALARRFAAIDAHMQGLGCTLVEAAPGQVVLRLEVGAEHLNFYGFCHGGVIFTLADSAFGLACNAHGVISVAIAAHITFSTAVREGDVLTATATELARTRRTGAYRVDVYNDGGTLVSQFTGTAHVTDKPVAEADAPATPRG